MNAFKRAHALAPWFGVASGWLAAMRRLTGREDRAAALLAVVGPTSKSLWGRVVYHLLTSEFDAAADWYEPMIEPRDPFALLYARKFRSVRRVDVALPSRRGLVFSGLLSLTAIAARSVPPAVRPTAGAGV